MRSLLALLLLCAACGGDDGPPIEGECKPDLTVFGEFADLESLAGSFAGIGGAHWSVGEEGATSAPNGRIELCLAPEARNVVSVVAPAPYLSGVYVADRDVFADGTVMFSQYGASAAQLGALYQTFGGLTYDATRAQLLVEVKGAPATPTLTGATAATTRYFTADRTWSATGPGSYVLFVNVAPGTGTIAVADESIEVPLTAGAWAMTTVAP
jgi:hypothetical protein